MTDVTIDQLPTIGSNQSPDADSMIQQDGTSFKAPTRPNPPLTLNVSSQAQLVSSLGSTLVVPDNVDLTIKIDESFSLSLPFLVGNNSGLEIRGSKVGNIITYTGPGALIQNNNPGVDESRFVFLETFSLIGDGTNSFFDIVLSSPSGFAVLEGVNIANLGSIGSLTTPLLFLTRLTGFNLTQGLVVKNSVTVRFNNVILSNFAETNTTWITIIDSVPTLISLRDIDASNVTTGDSLFFLDPNAVSGTSFIINGSRIVGGGNFYQQGVDIAINSVADNTSGNAEFTANSAHSLVVGTPVVLSGFSESTYNGTFIVTAISGLTFDVEAIAFVATDTGNMNKKSLDQTDVLVCSQGNSDSPNSLSVGGWAHTTNVALTTVADGTFGALNLSTGGGVTPFVENERFLLDVANDGTLQYIGVQSITVTLIGVLSITKSGSTQNYNLRYAIDRGSGFVALPTTVERSQSISTTSRDSTLNQQVILDTDDKIRLEIEGVGTTDSVTVVFGSLDISI